MGRLILEGCGTALVTPFKNGEVDYDAYERLVDDQVRSGVDFLVALATTGETPTLSADEKVRLLEITKSHAGTCKVIAGCGSNSVRGTLENMALLENHGADVWLVVVPFYNKPTQEGQYLYFKEIASHSNKPVLIYNVPGRTGANMLPQTCLRIARDCPNVIGTKEASGKIEQVAEICNGAPQDFSVLSGDDDLTLEFMKKGARGVISVASNVAPSLVSQMTRAALRGDMKEAERLNGVLGELFVNCFVESNPIPVKAALELMGRMGSEVRLPLSQATPDTRAIMSETLKKLGLV